MTSKLTCPRTGVELTPLTVGGVEVDISEGCGGIWLSRHALEHLKFEDHDSAEELLELLERHHKPIEGPDERLRSPAAPDVIMMRRYYSPVRKIEIDECAITGGIWLDPGELAGIRKKFPSREEYERVSREFIDEVMSSPEVAGALAASEPDADHRRGRFARLRELLSRLFG